MAQRIGSSRIRTWLAAASAVAVIASGCRSNESAEPVSIMPIGDSITDRAGWSTYRCFLHTMLDEAGVDFDFVGSQTPPASTYTCPTDFDTDHEAVDGDRIDDRATAAIASVGELQPDVALVMLGANDIASGEPPDEVADELAGFIGDLRAASSDTTFLVATYSPCLVESEWCQISQPALNGAIGTFRNLSTDSAPVVVVDMATDFDLDGVQDVNGHTNDIGDTELARRWMAGLVEAGFVDDSTT